MPRTAAAVPLAVLAPQWVASDEGSGFWIGLDAIRVVSRSFYHGEDTTLFQRFCSEYHVASDDERAIIACFRKLAVAEHDMKAEIAGFATSVCAAAQKGDDAAQQIVKRQAESLATLLAVALRRQLALEEIGAGLDIVLCGSVLSNPFYQSAFKSMVSLTLFGGKDETDIVSLRHVDDGMSAAFELARRLEVDPDSLMTVGGEHLPIVLRY